MEYYLIDSHCHLDKFIHRGSLDEYLQRAEESNVRQMIAVGTGPKDWDLYYRLAQAKGPQVAYTVGLHPCSVDERWQEATQQLAPFFTNEIKPMAVGEIGLDYFHLPKDEEKRATLILLQEQAFRQQLDIAAQFGCPVVIHSRGAFAECVKVIDESAVDWRKVVFHCFAEGADEIAQLNGRGGYGSFTGVITYKNAENVREAALQQGLERLILETDAPYLAPVPKRGKENEPAYTAYIAAFCAELFGVSVEEITQRSFENTKRLFSDLPDLA